MTSELNNQIMSVVEKKFDEQVDFLSELSSFPSTRGNEQTAQAFMVENLKERGYKADTWTIDVNDIAHLPGFSPVIGNYEDAHNVVGTHSSYSQTGKTLILNGHIDVVPVGPLDMWTTPPFEPVCNDGWMYGRGTGDMKAGLAANLFALDALKDVGFEPAANVHIQSVVEEECTGNGALACLQRGYRADAALIPEPFEEKLVTAQIGVIWLQVHLRGIPVHVHEARSGASAIEAAIPIIAALRQLEERWNFQDRKHPHYSHIDHPLNLNIGRIEGGDWASSVPSWCCFDVRMAIYPEQNIVAAREELEACIYEAASADAYLKKNPPEIICHGFLAEGYALADHNKPEADRAILILDDAHRTVTGSDLEKIPITATTDARFFGLYADTPALVYGPTAKAIHGFDERVNLNSICRITQSIALFIAGWCGLEKVRK